MVTGNGSGEATATLSAIELALDRKGRFGDGWVLAKRLPRLLRHGAAIFDRRESPALYWGRLVSEAADFPPPDLSTVLTADAWAKALLAANKTVRGNERPRSHGRAYSHKDELRLAVLFANRAFVSVQIRFDVQRGNCATLEWEDSEDEVSNFLGLEGMLVLDECTAFWPTKDCT